jgi:uncharacterized membrane protein YtjA (UPF0391 family)
VRSSVSVTRARRWIGTPQAILQLRRPRFGTLAARPEFSKRTIKVRTPPSATDTVEKKMGNLLHYALVFLVVALIAAAVGFGGVAGFAMEAARLLFWVFIVLFVISLVAGLVRRA